MENSSSGFKIKSLAKTTAREQELGALMDLLHKKKKGRKRGRMLSCLMCADLVAISGQLGPGSVCLCLLACTEKREGRERRALLTAEQREEEGGSRLYRTGFPLLPVCYLLCLVCQWCKSECLHPPSSRDNRE